jgi:hypothetical protein
VERQNAERPGSCDECAEEVRKHDAARDVNDDEGVEKNDAIEVHPHVRREVKLAIRRDPRADGMLRKGSEGDNPQKYAESCIQRFQRDSCAGSGSPCQLALFSIKLPLWSKK